MDNPQIIAMRKLGMSDDEIKDVLETDKRIDKGENPFPLNAAQEKISKSMRQADRKPTVYKFQKRERKANLDKRGIIEILSKAITEVADDDTVEITNAERELIFFAKGKKYKIVLSMPRS